MNTKLTEDQERVAGEALAKLLRLRKIGNSCPVNRGRFKTAIGAQTEAGLYRVLRRAFDGIEVSGRVTLLD